MTTYLQARQADSGERRLRRHLAALAVTEGEFEAVARSSLSSATVRRVLTHTEIQQLPVTQTIALTAVPAVGTVLVPRTVLVVARFSVAYTAAGLVNGDILGLANTFSGRLFAGFFKNAADTSLADLLASTGAPSYLFASPLMNSLSGGQGSPDFAGINVDNLEGTPLAVVAYCNGGVAFGGGHTSNTLTFSVTYDVLPT